MSDVFEDVLFEGDALKVTLRVDAEGQASVLLESEPGGPDLSVEDEVIVVGNGQGCPLEVESPQRAVAKLGSEDQLATGTYALMVRVHEFFEGWEFGEG